MCWLPGRPLMLPNSMSPPKLLPVGNHPTGSCPCGNLWWVGSGTFTSSTEVRVNSGWGGFISSQTCGTPFSERRACGWPVETCWQMFPSVLGTLLTTCRIKFKPECLPGTYRVLTEIQPLLEWYHSSRFKFVVFSSDILVWVAGILEMSHQSLASFKEKQKCTFYPPFT